MDPPDSSLIATDIDAPLVEKLVREQFPEWAGLAVVAVADQGWDNRTFRLGSELSVRLPSADGYVPGLIREQRTLSLLAPQLEIAVPQVVASGAASKLFGRPWSVRSWIPGRTLKTVDPADRMTALGGMVEALRALRSCDTSGGALAGPASAYRGCHVSVLGEEVQRGVDVLEADLAVPLRELWQSASATVHSGAPSWVHGDLAPGNVLFDDSGRITALIDFGQSCIGDPACDLSFLSLCCNASERDELRRLLEPEDRTWMRGAVWALWKTLVSSQEDLLATYGRDRMHVLEDLAAFS